MGTIVLRIVVIDSTVNVTIFSDGARVVWPEER